MHRKTVITDISGPRPLTVTFTTTDVDSRWAASRYIQYRKDIVELGLEGAKKKWKKQGF